MNTEARCLGAALRASRAILNWSQTTLAEKTNISILTISRIETCKVEARYSIYIKIIRALNEACVNINFTSMYTGFTIEVKEELFKKEV